MGVPRLGRRPGGLGRDDIAHPVCHQGELKLVDQIENRYFARYLADNAAKFTDRGRVEVMVEDDGDELIVHFRDTCQGLSPEELRTIFEPFERGATRKAGTGLGLAIARRAVEAQGGSIGAESPGQAGCHFWLRIPAAGRPKPQEH